MEEVKLPTTSQEFIHQSNIKDTGYGIIYTMESAQLKPLRTIWRHV